MFLKDTSTYGLPKQKKERREGSEGLLLLFVRERRSKRPWFCERVR